MSVWGRRQMGHIQGTSTERPAITTYTETRRVERAAKPAAPVLDAQSSVIQRRARLSRRSSPANGSWCIRDLICLFSTCVVPSWPPCPLFSKKPTRRQRRRLTVASNSTATQRDLTVTHMSQANGAVQPTATNMQSFRPSHLCSARPQNGRSNATGSASDRRPRDCARMLTGLPSCPSWRAKYDVQRQLHQSRVPEALFMTTRIGGGECFKRKERGREERLT
ncbi:uncharacterized protein IWZ02DRAFT_139974 [Phyllosticta citriasiana]|uniref:uncharacterized protein n=1 Tax=Phyllosticta citriasiana TaxID=595635 RepID=UPI0030FD7558